MWPPPAAAGVPAGERAWSDGGIQSSQSAACRLTAAGASQASVCIALVRTSYYGTIQNKSVITLSDKARNRLKRGYNA